MTEHAPLRVLVLDTVMDRGGAETMMMNYLRHFDRSKVTYDFLVNRDYRAAYEDEIEALGGRIYRMCPMYPQSFGTSSSSTRNIGSFIRILRNVATSRYGSRLKKAFRYVSHMRIIARSVSI